MPDTDVLILGAGLAGERAALEVARAGWRVLMISLVPPRRSHSAAAQGGAQAALGHAVMSAGDDPDRHFADTVRGADFGCDQNVVRRFVELAPEEIRLAAHLGMPWNRIQKGRRKLPDGRTVRERPEAAHLIDARNFGGTSKWRACFSSDGTGHALLYTLDSQISRHDIPVRDRMEALALIHDGTHCHGAVVRCLRSGNLEALTARATVIATGGCGRLYRHSTNALINQGSGLALALETGRIPLANMEAVQFHPTALAPSDILITEGARGDGGVLLDRHHRRFMVDYDPERMELAPRDVVARAMRRHMDLGLGQDSGSGPHLWLDIRHLGEDGLNRRLSEIRTICRVFNGLDPARDLIPVRPAQHYAMGGVRTDMDGRARGLDGLYAVGEAACWDLHGFNRLGGNSLTETLVAGRVAGSALVRDLARDLSAPSRDLARETLAVQKQRVRDIRLRAGKENAQELWRVMNDTLTDRVGIFREAQGLGRAVEILEELLDRSLTVSLKSDGGPANPELGDVLRLPGLIKVALCIANGALARTESRGSHFRTDFPDRDDPGWLKRTLALWPEGPRTRGPDLSYEAVDLSEMQPESTERNRLPSLVSA